MNIQGDPDFTQAELEQCVENLPTGAIVALFSGPIALHTATG